MKKILFMSIILMTFVIPFRAAGRRNPVTGLRRAVFGMAAWIVFYVALMSVMNPS